MPYKELESKYNMEKKLLENKDDMEKICNTEKYHPSRG